MKKIILWNFFWAIFSAVGLQGAVMLTTLLLARLLDLERFGIYALTTTTVMTMAGIAQGGVGVSSTKFIGEWLHHKPDCVGGALGFFSRFTFFMGCFAATLLAITAPYIANYLFENSGVTWALLWASPGILFHVQATFLLGALQGFGSFRSVAYASAIAGLSHLVSSVFGAWMWGLEGAVAAFTLSSIIRWLVFKKAVNLFCEENCIIIQSRIGAIERSMIWRFSIPAWLASLATLPSIWGVTALVARQNGGVSDVGLFTIAHQLRLLLLQLPSIFNAVAHSLLSRLKGLSMRDDFGKVFKWNIFFGLAFSVLMGSVVIFYADVILGVYGSEFIGGRDLLVILMIALVPEILGITVHQRIQSANEMWKSLFMISLPRDFLYFLLALFFIPAYGLIGAGLAYLFAHSFSCIATIIVAVRVSRQMG